jgi:hypothetical protein
VACDAKTSQIRFVVCSALRKRNNMVQLDSGGDPAFSLAPHTERMRLKPSAPALL